MRPLWTLLMLLALAAHGQDTNGFHAYAGSVNLIEGGRVPIVVADWGDQRYTVRCPVDFNSHVDNGQRMIRFDAKSGSVAINISFTTNSPGDLPPVDDLKTTAMGRHPNSTFMQSSPFPTSYKPGLYFDLIQFPTPGAALRTRHGFLPTPKGIVEFVFSASDTDFESLRVVCMQTIGTLSVETIKHKESDQ